MLLRTFTDPGAMSDWSCLERHSLLGLIGSWCYTNQEILSQESGTNWTSSRAYQLGTLKFSLATV